MFPRITQRIVQNAIIGEGRQSAAWGTKACRQATPMQAMCISHGHARHNLHATKPWCIGSHGGWPPPCHRRMPPLVASDRRQAPAYSAPPPQPGAGS